MKKALKVVLCVLGAVVALAALGILFLTITEYRPADVEQLEVICEEHDGGVADPVSPQLQAGEDVKMQQTLIPAIMQGVNGITYVDMKGLLDDLDGGSSGTYKHGTIKVGLRQQPVITNDSIEVTVSG